MASSRAYVPSRLLIRALSRPLPQRCPFARPLTATFTRGKRSRAAKTEKTHLTPADPKEVAQMVKDTEKSMDDDDLWEPMVDKELEADDLPVISWYEQDLDKGTPRRHISTMATAEDRKYGAETYRMIQESYRNPNYDDAELNRRLMDDLIANPNFADLTQDLKEIKAGIRSREEEDALAKQQEEDMARESHEFEASLKMATHQALQDLVNDPDAAAAKAELQDMLDKMPEIKDFDSEEFQATLDKAMSKLNDDPTFQKKLAAMPKADDDAVAEFDNWERQTEEEIRELERDDDGEDNLPTAPEDIGDVDKLMIQMRDVLKSIDGDSPLVREFDTALSDDDPNGVDFDREMDPEELALELQKLAESAAPHMKQQEEDGEEEHISPELKKKVDDIMADPKLMQKLIYIQSLIAQNTTPSSPDPTSLPASRMTTIQQQIQAARSDPQHTAALARLRVHLHPPFNISPALKSFNTAIELAYIGANDDIRRILWRSYMKARSLPTFLQNVGDDAWDLVYYSQAVNWGSNRNREAHLQVLIRDLGSLGREGPPTSLDRVLGSA